MNYVKGIFLLGTVLMITGCEIDKETMAMFIAKSMCSCKYVVGQSEFSCRQTILPSLIVGDAEMDDVNRKVTGKSKDGTQVATFRFVSDQLGCELEN